ncbi:MAG: dockerin type I repeat-containing protein [Oscillospiraceae bacterium]|nr:dockerin type I repeat-containing protein [Oscillospiraceae bacterium]
MMKKKMLSMLIAACCMAQGALPCAAAGQTRAGDANCDGRIDVSDAVLTARFAAEDRNAVITDQGRANADVTGNGNVDAEDTTKILQYIAKKISYAELAGTTIAEPPLSEYNGMVFRTTDALIQAVKDADLSDYNSVAANEYGNLFARLKGDGFVYSVKPNADVALQENGQIRMHPAHALYDAYIRYPVTYNGKYYEIAFCMADQTLAAGTDSFAAYYKQRMGYDATGTFTAGGREYPLYQSADGSQVWTAAFFENGYYFTAVGNGVSADDLTGLLNALEYEKLAIPAETQPVVDVTPQPIRFQSTNAVKDAIAFYDFSGYQETDRWAYERMFDRFMDDGFFWKPASSDAYLLREDCVLYPYAAYEDIGIGYYVQYGGKNCHAVIYSADKELLRQTDGIADYLMQRMGRGTDKTVTVQGRAVSLTLQDDGTVYAGAFIDGTHFYAVHGELSEAEMTDFLNALTFEKQKTQSANQLVPPESGKEKPGTSARIALQCKAFCPAGEALTVDAAVGYAADIPDSDQHHFEYGVCAWNPVLYKQSEDAKLRINGEPDSFVKAYPAQESGAFAVDMYTLDYETWHHETTVLDFSRYEAGSTGRIRFSFTLYLTENPEHPSSMGADRLLYYFVGENGTGFGGSAAEAEQNYRSASDAELLLHEPYTGKWNGKFVSRMLFNALTENTGEKITVSFDVNPDYSYVYKGRTLEAISRDRSDVFNETLFKLEELLLYGDAMKYGEVLYTTGTPTGQKWTKEWYEDRLAYFGTEMLEKYIVNGEFRKVQLTADLAALKQQYQAAYDEAEAACYQAMTKSIIETLAAQNIRCRQSNAPNRLAMEVNADEFAALNLAHVTAYWLGANGPDAIE